MGKFLVFLIAGWSGFFVMSLELLSGRILASDFGSSIHVWGGIITVFMLSLAIGYLAGGSLSLREPSLKKLSLLLAAAAAATIPVVLLNEPVLEYISSLIPDPRYGAAASSMTLFFLPTIICGMVSPYAVRLLVQDSKHSGKLTGVLFFVSTFGSAAGTILTSFYFVLLFDVHTILWMLIGISAAVAVLTLVAGNKSQGIPNKLLSFSCLLLALGLATPSRAETVIHRERSAYRDILVFEQDGMRCMRFSRKITARQSCFYLGDPDKLAFRYTRMMMGALYLVPNPRRILIIGLGGGTLPNTLSSLYPDSEIHAVEIDGAVIKVAEKYFGFRSRGKMKIFEEDGRMFVKRAIRKKEAGYDLIFLDAFDQEYIPEHLLTKEFLEELKRIMVPGGVLAANTWSSSKLYDHESATYESVYGKFFNLKDANRVILAKRGGLPAMDEVERNSRALAPALKRFNVEAELLLPLFSTRKDWRDNTRVLTDRYSPSNLLNAK